MTTPKIDRELLELAAKAAGLDTSHEWNRASVNNRQLKQTAFDATH